MNLGSTLQTTGFVTLLAFAAPALALAQGAGTATPGQTNQQSAATMPGTTNGAAAQTHMSKDQVKNVLKDQGYSDISDLKQSDGHYTANAKRYGEEEKDLKINATTGEVMNQKELSKDQVKKLLKDKDYSDVQDIKHSGNEFTANAKQNDNKMNLTIDSHTGMILSQQARK